MTSVLIAILAKDKAHCLPLYLRCLEQQTWPASQTHIYIRTNNNNDDTLRVLAEWVERVHTRYATVFFDASDVETRVQDLKPHEWTTERFQVLGKIRQESIATAQKLNAHYFVADCDNFIVPTTIADLVATNLPVVGPLLKRGSGLLYSNYHHLADAQGYYAHSPHYETIWGGAVRGLIEVAVIHCTYLVRAEVLSAVAYLDDTTAHEYVIFSRQLRAAGIPQYIDNRKAYGEITFAETEAEFQTEPWYAELVARTSE